MRKDYSEKERKFFLCLHRVGFYASVISLIATILSIILSLLFPASRFLKWFYREAAPYVLGVGYLMLMLSRAASHRISKKQ